MWPTPAKASLVYKLAFDSFLHIPQVHESSVKTSHPVHKLFFYALELSSSYGVKFDQFLDHVMGSRGV